jgi:hypothetical protein
MSARDGIRTPAPADVTAGLLARRVPERPAGARHTSALRAAAPPWSGYAWAAIGATATFIALTCWWLTQDHGVPIYDAGDHLETALLFHSMLRAGDLLGPFNHESPYPPLVFLVGALSAFVGGVNLPAPIIGENLVFVTLLALGCYQTARLLGGARAGLLAVLVVLASPLLIVQFHVFLLDAPEAAVVAISVWLLLASQDFSRVGISALAGLAVGAGLIIKVQYPSFVLGIVLIALARGGWRNRRGLVAFAVIALVLGTPWYIDHLAQFSTFVRNAASNPATAPANAPPTLSIANLTWYFWSMLNSQLLAPLFALLLGGTAWMAATLLRHRHEAWTAEWGSASSAMVARLELFAGAVAAWLFITLTPDHDIRYGTPLIPYLAVIATVWIVHLPRVPRCAAIAVLVLGVIANTAGTTFGVSGRVEVPLGQLVVGGEDEANTIRFYASAGFLIYGPQHDGDVPGLLAALRRSGVRTITWGVEQSRQPDFSFEGLLPLARIARLTPIVTETPEFGRTTRVATLIHMPVTARSPRPCTRLDDGTGVWVVRFDRAARKLSLYCPYRHPPFYSSAAAG